MGAVSRVGESVSLRWDGWGGDSGGVVRIEAAADLTASVPLAGGGGCCGGQGRGTPLARGFTLIELLVVVAVVGVLAGLLLPALARSKATAGRIRCVGSLHQMGLAVQMYWDDNGGRAFRYRGGSTNGGDVYWFGWISRGAEGERGFDPGLGVLHPYLKGRGIEPCPGLRPSASGFKAKAREVIHGFGYNLVLSASAAQPAFDVGRLARPGGLAVFADAAQVNTFQAPASVDNPMLEEFFYVTTNEATAHFRHGRLANVAFGDGHVGREAPVAGSLDLRLPREWVGRLRWEVLVAP